MRRIIISLIQLQFSHIARGHQSHVASRLNTELEDKHYVLISDSEDLHMTQTLCKHFIAMDPVRF